VVFRYAEQNQLIPTPVRFGAAFQKPPKKLVRLERQKKGPRMFEADELRKMIDAAGVPMKAMVLLGINCGFGNSDIANLPMKALDLQAGWVRFPRPKTGIERRCPLWPETVAAIRDALASRPTPQDKADGKLVFLTRRGTRWVTARLTDAETGKIACGWPLSLQFARLLKRLGLKRPGVAFYALRHTFETIAGDSRDQVAVDFIMGHARDDMASVYRERIDDDRLLTVVQHVHDWLFGEQKQD